MRCLKSNRDLSRGSLKWLETSQRGSLKWLETSLHAGIAAYLHFSTPHYDVLSGIANLTIDHLSAINAWHWLQISDLLL